MQKLPFMHNVKKRRIIKSDTTHQHIDIQAMWWWTMPLFTVNFCSF